MNRDAAFDRDCKAMMDSLPASAIDKSMPGPRGIWRLDLNQRGVDIVYHALAVLLHGPQPGQERTPPIQPPPDERLPAMLGPALAATIRIPLKQEK